MPRRQVKLTDLSEAKARARTHLRQNSASGLVCYTAVFGGYDSLSACPAELPGIEFYCFTDTPEMAASGWKVIPVDFVYRDPRRTARLFKLAPHLLFPAAEQSLWLDANLSVDRRFFELISRHQDDDFLCFGHSRRTNVYEEGAACIKHGKDEIATIKAQLERYRALGVPDKNGLINSSVLLRRHCKPEILAFQEKWLAETDRNCSRDQISFTFVAWNENFQYSLFDAEIHSVPGLRYKPHASWKFYDSKGKLLLYPRIVASGIYHRIFSFFNWR